MSGLRARQKALARRSILDAVSSLIAERRHLDFSLQEVAERAGVSLRTVYNHFEGREAVLDALADHYGELMVERGGVLIGDVDHVSQLRDAVAVNFRVFEELGGLSEAWLQVNAPAVRAVEEDHDRRTARIVELVAEALPDLGPVAQREVGLVLRHLLSQRTWFALTRDYGLDIDAAIRTVVWSFDSLLEKASRGEGPAAPEEE